MLSTRSKAHEVATREYERLLGKMQDAVDDKDRARRAVGKAFDVMADPATVSMTVNKALDGSGGGVLTGPQAFAVASWENARSRAAGLGRGVDALGKVLRQLDDEEVGR